MKIRAARVVRKEPPDASCQGELVVTDEAECVLNDLAAGKTGTVSPVSVRLPCPSPASTASGDRRKSAAGPAMGPRVGSEMNKGACQTGAGTARQADGRAGPFVGAPLRVFREIVGRGPHSFWLSFGNSTRKRKSRPAGPVGVPWGVPLGRPLGAQGSRNGRSICCAASEASCPRLQASPGVGTWRHNQRQPAQTGTIPNSRTPDQEVRTRFEPLHLA